MARPSPLRLDWLEDRCNPVALDPTFGAGGSLTRVLLPEQPIRGYTKLTFTDIDPIGVAVGPDGAITAVVADTLYVSTLAASTPVFQVVRLSADGKLDTAFGQGGIAFTPFPLPLDPQDVLNHFEVRAVTRLADGRLLVQCLLYPGRDKGGPNQTLFVRLLADGRLDTTYGQSGVATLPDTGTPADAGGLLDIGDVYLVGSDGRVIAVGGRAGGVAVLTPVSPDGAVGPTRRVALPTTDGAQLLSDAALAPDGKVLLCGFPKPPSPTSPQSPADRKVGLMMRVNPDGTPDPTFGTAGVFRRDGGVGGPLALQDGSVLYASTTGLGRLTPAGVPDPSFGGGDGEVGYTPALNRTALFVLPDGRVAMLGTFGLDSGAANTRSGIVVLRPDGSLEPSFGTGGAAVLTDKLNELHNPRLGPPNRLVVSKGGSLVAYDLTAPNPPDLIPVKLTESAPPNPAIPKFGQPVLTQTFDLTGDGSPDRIELAQAGGPPRVRVTSGATGRVIADEMVYEESFTGGLFAAAADLDGDGKAELIVSPDVGGGARVRVLTLVNGKLVARDDFFAIDDPGFRGGARVTAGDLDGDGRPEVVVGAGFGGGPRVAVYDGRGLLQGAASPPKLVGDFFAFPGPDAANLRNGVFLSAGDLDGDGRADLAFGGGPGGAPRVFVLSGARVAAGQVAAAQDGPLANFFVDDDLGARTGARVAVADLDRDGKPELAAFKADPANTQPVSSTRPVGVNVYRADALLRSGGKAPASSFTPDMADVAIPLLGVNVS
jgi:uncharacterized delta-60 repeat protein